MPDFLFRTAVMKTTGVGGESGDQVIRLTLAGADGQGAGRRPLRLRLAGQSRRCGGLETTIEMSRSEAYAFSEWLDAAVTQTFAKPLAKRGPKG